MVPVGELALWDIEVDGANHYVSYPNIVHRNCESYADVLQYQGQAFQYIGYDELGQVGEERIWTYLVSRNRPTAPGQVLQMRASANPGGAGHHWLKKRFVQPCHPDGSATLIDGFTRAFVAAKLKDNPTLMENDPAYGERLRLLPDLEYQWLAEGNWDAGAGLAFNATQKHIVPAFTPPSHWPLFGALDWGYNHPFSWGLYTASEDGMVYCVDTATGRHLQPDAIADRFKAIANGRAVRYTVAGHDVWADVKARSEHIPTLAEQFAAHGFPMVKANISRIAGVQNCRRYLQLIGEEQTPRFAWMDTPTNRKVFECIESRVSDPDHPEDVLKVDADDSGTGGDDHYDQWRYALASRPIAAVLPTQNKSDKPQDRGLPFDWDRKKFPDQQPDQTLDRILNKHQAPAHRVPVNTHRLPRVR